MGFRKKDPFCFGLG